MPLSDEIRSLLLKYIAGETDEEETALVEGWLKNDPKIFKEFEQLWDLWYAVGTATNVFRFNVDKGWNETLGKIRESRGNKKRSQSLKRVLIWSSGIAAALILLLGLSFWRNAHQTKRSFSVRKDLVYRKSRYNIPDTVAVQQHMNVQTPPGKRKQVWLPDGSMVWLNGGTSIRFTIDKKEHLRLLYLKGQAFFDIRHHINSPFVVKTEHATVKVLGTRFDVSAYPEDSVVEATLTEGSILFTTVSNNKPVKRHITPGQQVAINYLSGQLSVLEVDTTFYSSWKEGRLLFSNQCFKEVARAMEHKYNVAIEFKDPELMRKRLNGYLEKETLKEALTALKLTLQFKYEIRGNKVIIYK